MIRVLGRRPGTLVLFFPDHGSGFLPQGFTAGQVLTRLAVKWAVFHCTLSIWVFSWSIIGLYGCSYGVQVLDLHVSFHLGVICSFACLPLQDARQERECQNISL